MMDSCAAWWKRGDGPEPDAAFGILVKFFVCTPCDRWQGGKLHAFVTSPAWMPDFAFAVRDGRWNAACQTRRELFVSLAFALKDIRQRARRRSLELGLRICSRYFATVRRATCVPRRFSSAVSVWSESGLAASSSSTSLRIIAWIAVADALPPSSVATLEEKKCLNSNVPRGVCRYLRVVTREIVDSCMPSSSASSRITSGFIASGP